jgi:hypothetical protein
MPWPKPDTHSVQSTWPPFAEAMRLYGAAGLPKIQQMRIAGFVETSSMKPTVGRIVHFVQGELHLPAIIVRVWSDTCVNLQVFTDGSNSDQVRNTSEAPNLKWVTSVTLDETATQQRSWHWPERES